jgi:hypothetical protein
MIEIEEELISALDELKKKRKKSRYLKEQLDKKHSQEISKESLQVIMNLKYQLE